MLPKNKSRTYNKGFGIVFVLILLGVIAVLAITSLRTSIKYGKLQTQYPSTSDEQKQAILNKGPKCDYEGLPKDQFLEIYVVKSGDTLFSIAKNQMGDISRINELIELNKKVYPFLTIEKPILEPGMKMYFTPDEIGVNSGKLFSKGGKILSIDDQKIALLNDTGGSVGYHYFRGKITFEDIKVSELAPGDCVYIITDEGGGFGIVLISPQ
jgi:hypothetical protein